jgi:hypothetical protein
VQRDREADEAQEREPAGVARAAQAQAAVFAAGEQRMRLEPVERGPERDGESRHPASEGRAMTH